MVVTRVYLADETPTLYATTYIPDTTVGSDIDAAAEEVHRQGQAGQSLFTILETLFHVTVDYAMTRIRAIVPPDSIADELAFDPNEPCIELDQIFHDADGRVRMYSQDVLDPEVFELIVVRKSLQ